MKKLKKYEMFITENYFNDKLPSDIKKHSKKYVGDKVTWYGDSEQMIVVNSDQVHGMWGNIYDNDKFNSLVEQIKYSEENIELECSYGLGTVIDIIDIREHQQAYHNNSFDIDYEEFDNPYTIGDEELDNYLGNEDYISEKYQYIDDMVQEFFIKNRFDIAENLKSENDIREEFMKLIVDSDDIDYSIEVLEEFIDIETELKESIENNEGDLNKFEVQLRDGHHRVMAAIEAGEDKVCVNLAKEDIEKFKDFI